MALCIVCLFYRFEQARELLNNRKGSLQKILSIAAVQSNSTSNKAKSFKKNKITHVSPHATIVYMTYTYRVVYVAQHLPYLRRVK